MLRPKLENKGPGAALVLDQAQERHAAVQAELDTLSARRIQVQAEIDGPYPEDLEGLHAQIEQIERNREALRTDLPRLQAAVAEARVAKVQEDWQVELLQQRNLTRRFEKVGKAMEDAAATLSRLWDEYEAVHHENHELTRRAEYNAQRYNREPLPAVDPIFAMNLPGRFLQAVQPLAKVHAILPELQENMRTSTFYVRNQPPRAPEETQRGLLGRLVGAGA
jgi:archaellum component FlaC